MNLVYTIINLIVLFLLLRHFLIKPVSDIMEKRRQMIADGLQSAQDAQSDAQKMKQEYEEIRRGCQAFDLPLSVDSLNAGDVLAATKKDKKMEAGHIKFILMDGIGKSFIDKTVTDQELLQAIREILI